MDMNSRLANVLDRIRNASSQCSSHRGVPRLVAVSKTRPAEDVVEAYQLGQRHFGENYIAELVEKSKHPQVLTACPEICWHFIGHLQSNKVKLLVNVPNLYLVETIHSSSLAKKLNDAWAKRITATSPRSNQPDSERLKIFIQVKTSEDEETKSGCDTNQVLEVADFVRKSCPNLVLSGLMTIGSQQNSLRAQELNANPDFASLVACKEQLCTHYANDELAKNLELSMGMSADFEIAAAMGSTNIRVGSLIFGPR